MVAQPNNMSTKENPVGRFMVAVGAVVEYKKTGKILITKRASTQDWRPGDWEIGYGRIDQFEDPIDGLKREFFEEVGLTDLQVGKILSAWHIYRGPKKAENDLIGITYHCTTNTEKIVLSYEHEAYRWVNPEEALLLVKEEGIQRDVKRFIEMKSLL